VTTELLKHPKAIAIIGMAGRFPGARNLDEFQQNLENGVESITFFSEEELLANGVPPEQLKQPNYVKAAPLLEDADLFDAAFFQYSATEAEMIDPQHRIFLECAWTAMESAGYAGSSVQHSVGVFAGAGSIMGSYLLSEAHINHRLIGKTAGRGHVGNDKDYLSTRVSYKLDLRGPSFTVQTACSSSLVAIHLACQSLLNEECEMALAGGVTVRVPQRIGYRFQEGEIYSPDGHCRTFDAGGQGMLFGSGVGIVVLKLLAKAVADGDSIEAVIRGSAIKNDGSRKTSYWAPSVEGQAEAITQALAVANINPETIGYVETHGTATYQGDPVEILALTKAFQTHQKHFCAVGSVKTNIGHADAAAGIAGLLKTVLSLKHKTRYPNLHFSSPNPKIDFENSPFYVSTALQEWKSAAFPRRAAVNALGIGGTNAHIILEEAPTLPVEQAKVERSHHILTLSAKTPEALQALTEQYGQHLRQHPTQTFKEVCYTANTGRAHFSHRLALIAISSDEAMHSLQFKESNEQLIKIACANSPPKLAFLFTGQGSQYVNMGHELYETQQLFRQVIQRCDDILQPYLGQSLLSILYPSPSNTPLPFTINDTIYTQPALFAIEYALAELWKSWGIKPDIVIGHSIGEYVAACVAGIFSLEDGLKLIAARGRLIQNLSQDGAMIAIFADEQQVQNVIAPYTDQVSIAAINGPENVVVSGQSVFVNKIAQIFDQQQIRTQQLTVSHAFHSPLMEPMLAAFAQVANEIQFSTPTLKLLSNATGQLTTDEMANSKYWVDHVRRPVYFAKGMHTLYQLGYELFVEMGPKPTLLGMGKNCLPESYGVWLPSLRSGQSEWQQLLDTLGELYVRGAEVDWKRFEDPYPRRRVTLPTYPFQRQRYWITPDTNLPQTHSHALTSDNLKLSHPLLGVRQNLAISTTRVFESHISAKTLAYLRDHLVFDKAIMPASAYLDIALATGITLYQSTHFQLKNISIAEALYLPETEPLTIQSIVTSEETNAVSVQIYQLNESDDKAEPSFKCYASAQIVPTAQVQTPKPVDLMALQARCIETISAEVHYQNCQQRQLQYGPHFQAVRKIFRDKNTLLGQIELPEPLQLDNQSYHLHPVLLDACFQTTVAAMPTEKDGHLAVYLPVGIEKVTFFKHPGSSFWSQAQIEFSEDGHMLTADVRLLDNTGTVIAEIERLSLRRASPKTLQRLPEDWLYQIQWQPKALEPCITPPKEKTGSWFIFGGENALSLKMTERLRADNKRCILISVGLNYHKITTDHYAINPVEPKHFQRLLIERVLPNESIEGIVHFWSLEIDEAMPPLDSLPLGCGSVLYLIQALARTEYTPRLWLITQESQPVIGPTALRLQQAPLWGMGRIITLENPSMKCVCVDMASEDAHQKTQTDMLYAELLAAEPEDRIAYREGTRYVARFASFQDHSVTSVPNGKAFQIKTNHYGILDHLHLAPLTERTLGPDDVEIEVRAVGLNFRDVLRALGMLHHHEKALGMTSATQAHFGFECAGVIKRVGERVTRLAVGEEVMAAPAMGALASSVMVNSNFVIPKPQGLSFTETATLPLVFLTALYGLEYLAKIQPGERVLIHSAAGGVGLAAVQLAQRAGAEIFATASAGKWDFLRQMGVKHIMDSRTLNFADEILTLTEGQGVDIVLNSLNGEFIDKSFEVLGAKGRFIEIGKIGIWEPAQVQAKRPDVSYYPFDLSEIAQTQPTLITDMLAEIRQRFQDHSLVSLPLKVFPVQQIVDAFRYIQQTKHIGKVVIAMPEPEHNTPMIKQNASYLITGGLGALGLQVALWLSEQGAKHLILTSRHGAASELAQQTVATLENRGTKIQLVQADVANQDDVKRMLAASSKPLRGIIHAAGVLDNGVLLQQSMAQFNKVMAPKIQGSWHLHQLTQELPLDFWVCFSSVASVWGTLGQGNYAAANAFLDALAHHRQALGLPALTINWGPWGEIGMIANLDQQKQQRLREQGLKNIPPQQGIQILAHLLQKSVPQVSVLPVDWSKALQGTWQGLPFFAAFTTDKPVEVGQEPSLLQHLSAALKTSTDIRTPLITYLRTAIGQILGLQNANQIEMRQRLFDMGFDSLMAVELRSRLEKSVGHSLRTTLLFDYPTLEALTDYLTLELQKNFPELTVKPVSVTPHKEESDPQNQVEKPSLDELASLLAQELAD